MTAPTAEALKAELTAALHSGETKHAAALADALLGLSPDEPVAHATKEYLSIREKVPARVESLLREELVTRLSRGHGHGLAEALHAYAPQDVGGATVAASALRNCPTLRLWGADVLREDVAEEAEAPDAGRSSLGLLGAALVVVALVVGFKVMHASVEADKLEAAQRDAGRVAAEAERLRAEEAAKQAGIPAPTLRGFFHVSNDVQDVKAETLVAAELAPERGDGGVAMVDLELSSGEQFIDVLRYAFIDEQGREVPYEVGLSSARPLRLLALFEAPGFTQGSLGFVRARQSETRPLSADALPFEALGPQSHTVLALEHEGTRWLLLEEIDNARLRPEKLSSTVTPMVVAQPGQDPTPLTQVSRGVLVGDAVVRPERAEWGPSLVLVTQFTGVEGADVRLYDHDLKEQPAPAAGKWLPEPVRALLSHP